MTDSDVDLLLRRHASSWVDQAPAEPDLSELMTRIADARAPRSNWKIPVAASIALVAAVAGALMLVRAHHTPPPSVSAHPYQLTETQRALALDTAHREADGANLGQTGPVPRSKGWQYFIDSVSASVMPYSQAGDLGVAAAPGRPEQVLVVRLIGRFSLITTGPPGHSNANGNVLTVVVSLATGQVTDAGIKQDAHPTDLPHQTVLFQR
jgi:hypothetical protein